MKRLISFLLCVILLSGTVMIPPAAAEQTPEGEYGVDYYRYGDVDADQSINAVDALLVLRFGVQTISLEPVQQILGDVSNDTAVNAVDALLILQYAVGLIPEFPAGVYYADTLGEGEDPEAPDGIPDKYQKQIVFQVQNGSWADGSTANRVVYVTLTTDGKWDVNGTAPLVTPTDMIPFEGYEQGGWDVTPPTVVGGTAAQTYTYSFLPITSVPGQTVVPGNQVGYLTRHYVADEQGNYPEEPTETQFNVGTVGQSVTAAANSYEGYCLNTQQSVTQGTLSAIETDEDILILALYYDADRLGADGVPDKYQKQVVFQIQNGSWADGTSADQTHLLTLTKNGMWDQTGSASLTVPTGMTANEGYEKGAWDVTPPATVTGTEKVTYTYSFTPIPVVTTANYSVYHYKVDADGSYPTTPTASQTFTGTIGETVTATANTYEGYCLNTQTSTVTGVVAADGGLVLTLYYDVDQVGGEVVTENYITQYDKSNVVNEAYQKDTTADTSFVVDTTSLDPLTMYVFNKGAISAVDNISGNDYARLIYSLQGLVNRDFGMDVNHSSLIYADVETSDAGWLSVITEEGTIMQPCSATGEDDGLSRVDLVTWEQFYDAFQDVIKSCGIILWDGNVPATANVAATICGLDGYLPVLANSPLHTLLVADGVPVKQSLVGLFADGNKGSTISGTTLTSTGSAKNDAYLWALEKYFNRCSTKYLAYTLDGAVCIKGYSAYGYTDHASALLDTASINCLANHDYLIARRCFFFDLAPYKGEAACDDPAQNNGQADIGTDNATMLKIFQARYDRANGAFGALMGFPPWWVKYTSHYSQGSQAATWIEWLYCEYITCYNLAKEADAQGPASMTNGSVYYKYVPEKSQYENNKTTQELTYNKNTYYYTIYLGDYDSSAWLKTHMYTMWMNGGGDAKRGTLPLMWGINPNLSYRVPMIFDYLYENKTANDYFVGGDGGAGYIIPAALFHDTTLSYMGEKRPTANAAAGDVFAAYSLPFYERFDLDITGFLINGNNGSITKNIAACVNQYSPIGSFVNASSMGIYKYNGTFYVNCYTGIAYSDASAAMYSFANDGMNSWFNKKNFGAYRTVCHTPTQIAGNVERFATYATEKGMTVQYCDPYTYFELLASSGQGTTIR